MKMWFRLFGVFMVFFATLSVGFVIFDAVYFPVKYKEEIVYAANEYDLEPSLVFAIVKTESGFDKNAISKKGAMGLMQLMPSTAMWVASKLNIDNFEIYDLYNPATNLNIGCYYFRYLLDKYKSVKAAAACYNAGEGAMQKYIDSNKNITSFPNAETAKYTQKIKNFAKIYKNKL